MKRLKANGGINDYNIVLDRGMLEQKGNWNAKLYCIGIVIVWLAYAPASEHMCAWKGKWELRARRRRRLNVMTISAAIFGETNFAIVMW